MINISILSNARGLAPGLLLVGTIALASQFIAARYGGPVMLYAILFGIAFNFLNDEPNCATGIQFASKRILQLGVVLLGAGVTLAEITALGWATAALVAGAVIATITIGWAVGRAGKLSSAHSVLSAGAVAICGASAAMAIASVLPQNKDSERNLILTVVGVTSLSTLAMVIYPSLTHLLGFSDMRAGIFLGATIHDVAQVIGAGYIVSDEAAEVAAVVKLMRVTLLAPAVLAIALVFSRSGGNAGATERAFPLFLIGFAALMSANSFGIISPEARAFLSDASRWSLVAAVSALGVKTSLKDLFEVGPRPVAVLFLQTLFLAGFVIAGGFFLSGALPR